MKTTLLLALASLFAMSAAGCASHSLLDEQLSQFENVYDHGFAEFNDGELNLIAKQNWFFSTKKEYSDFVLEASVKMPDTKEYSNSGIIFRGQIIDTDKGRSVIGYQAEVDPSERKWTGALFDQGRRKWLYPLHPKRSNRDSDFKLSYIGEWSAEQSDAYKHLQWNTLKIVCKGPDIKIFVNGILTTHVKDLKDKQGVIAFQHHGSKVFAASGDTRNAVRFKDIKISPL